MPTGPLEPIPLLVDALAALKPRRILDLGVGTGKYGFLLRERLDLQYRTNNTIIDGVEGYSAYIGPVQRAIYNWIDIADIRAWLTSYSGPRYDLCLLLDVIEHFPPNEAGEVARRAFEISEHLAVTTPKRFLLQAEEENPLEQHHSWWARSSLRQLGKTLGARVALEQLRDTNVAVLSHGEPPSLKVARLAAVLANVKDRLVPERLYYSALHKTGPTI